MLKDKCFSASVEIPRTVLVLDPIDKRILLELDTNCRLSYQELALKLGMTANAVRKRISKLIEQGVIEEFIAILRPSMTGAELLMCIVETDGSEDEEVFIQELGQCGNTIQVGPLAVHRGRAYLLLAECVGAEGLLDFRSYLSKHNSVINIELHTIVRAQGKSLNLTKLHLRVLGQLNIDARMSISDIAENAGLSARRVRRALDELLESESVWFATRWNLSAGESTEFYIRIELNEKTASREVVEEWLQYQYPQEYWYSFYSATDPVIFSKFVTNHFRDVEDIARKVKQTDFAESADTLICYPVRKFPRLGTTELEKQLKEAGLQP